LEDNSDEDTLNDKVFDSDSSSVSRSSDLKFDKDDNEQEDFGYKDIPNDNED
jgi:hypothetical protein